MKHSNSDGVGNQPHTEAADNGDAEHQCAAVDPINMTNGQLRNLKMKTMPDSETDSVLVAATASAGTFGAVKNSRIPVLCIDWGSTDHRKALNGPPPSTEGSFNPEGQGVLGSAPAQYPSNMSHWPTLGRQQISTSACQPGLVGAPCIPVCLPCQVGGRQQNTLKQQIMTCSTPDDEQRRSKDWHTVGSSGPAGSKVQSYSPLPEGAGLLTTEKVAQNDGSQEREKDIPIYPSQRCDTDRERVFHANHRRVGPEPKA